VVFQGRKCFLPRFRRMDVGAVGDEHAAFKRATEVLGRSNSIAHRRGSQARDKTKRRGA
jgi:hypothetical protein